MERDKFARSCSRLESLVSESFSSRIPQGGLPISKVTGGGVRNLLGL